LYVGKRAVSKGIGGAIRKFVVTPCFVGSRWERARDRRRVLVAVWRAKGAKMRASIVRRALLPLQDGIAVHN
jgi:hypothetical protein